jgi:hypothetical protein
VTKASSFTDTNVVLQNPFLALSTRILNVYSDAFRQNMENLTASSARIIQEETMRAWNDAVQSCTKALAKNAMSSQQRAMERINEANQKAFGILVTDFSPFKMQPMAGVANWMPPMANVFSQALSNLEESSIPKRKRRRQQ